jgi:hypothetical protein
MDPLDEFVSQEFVQYAAECRRMARLVRRPARPSQKVHPLSLHWLKSGRIWISKVMAGRAVNLPFASYGAEPMAPT